MSPTEVAWMLPNTRPQADEQIQIADMVRRSRRTLDEEGGFKTIQLALDDSDLLFPANGRTVMEPGYGLCFRLSGSNGAARIDVETGGGEIRSLAPGEWFMGRFKSFRVRNSPEGVALGVANLLILRRDDVLFRSEAPGQAGIFKVSFCWTNPGQTVASTANQPTALTDGASLTGVRAFRVRYQRDIIGGSKTMDGTGAFRIWFLHYAQDTSTGVWSTFGNQWSLANMQWAPEPGSVGWCSPDVPVLIPHGRVYVEALSIGYSGAADAVLPEIHTWGV